MSTAKMCSISYYQRKCLKIYWLLVLCPNATSGVYDAHLTLVVVPHHSVSFQVLDTRLHWIDKTFEDVTRLIGRQRLVMFTPET